MAGTGSSIKIQFLHRIVLAIPGPQLRAIDYCGCGDQGVAYLQAMTPAILPEIIASLAACFIVNRRAKEGAKELHSSLVLARQRSSPQFRRAYRRTQDCRSRSCQLSPLNQDILISFARNLDENVGVDQNTHGRLRLSSLSRRVSRRRLRTYSSVESGKSLRFFRIPTKASMALRRSSKLPR